MRLHSCVHVRACQVNLDCCTMIEPFSPTVTPIDGILGGISEGRKKLLAQTTRAFFALYVE